MTFEITCSTVLMIVGPPGLPVTRISLPSLVTKVGVIDESGRLPGVMELAGPWSRPNMFFTPTLAVKSSISLFMRMPVPGMVTPLPKPPLSV